MVAARPPLPFTRTPQPPPFGGYGKREKAVLQKGVVPKAMIHRFEDRTHFHACKFTRFHVAIEAETPGLKIAIDCMYKILFDTIQSV